MTKDEMRDRYTEIFSIVNKENYFKRATSIDLLCSKLNDYKYIIENNKPRRKIYIKFNAYLKELEQLKLNYGK